MISGFLFLCFIALILCVMFVPFKLTDEGKCKCGPNDGADIVCPKCQKRRKVVVRIRREEA